jgi:hypothetical protein
MRIILDNRADYDGDEMNLTLILDKHTRTKMERLAPYLGVMDLKRPWTISGNIKLPAPVITTINAWRVCPH